MLFSKIQALLNQSDDPPVLTGHLHPDYDSAAACLLMQHFFKQWGVDAQICLYGEMDTHSAVVLQKHGYDPAALFAPAPANALLILCDCHTTAQPGHVIACVDHHPTADIPDIPVYVNRPASSAGRIVYQEAVSAGLQTDVETDFLAVASVYMDTLACGSSKFQTADKPWITATAARRKFDLSSLQRDGLCLTDLTQPLHILAQNGFREHTIAAYRVGSSYIQGEAAHSAPIQDILDCCRDACISGAYDYWVFLCYVPLMKTTDIYLFDRKTKTWSHTYCAALLSRGNDIIPALERVLAGR